MSNRVLCLRPEADFTRGFELARPLGFSADGSTLSVQALVAIHWAHRAFALVVLVVLGALALRMAAADGNAPGLRRMACGLIAVLGAQIATGISNVVFAWPLAVAVVHNGGAAALALMLALLNARLAARRASAEPAAMRVGA